MLLAGVEKEEEEAALEVVVEKVGVAEVEVEEVTDLNFFFCLASLLVMVAPNSAKKSKAESPTPLLLFILPAFTPPPPPPLR